MLSSAWVDRDGTAWLPRWTKRLAGPLHFESAFRISRRRVATKGALFDAPVAQTVRGAEFPQ